MPETDALVVCAETDGGLPRTTRLTAARRAAARSLLTKDIRPPPLARASFDYQTKDPSGYRPINGQSQAHYCVALSPIIDSLCSVGAELALPLFEQLERNRMFWVPLQQSLEDRDAFTSPPGAEVNLGERDVGAF